MYFALFEQFLLGLEQSLCHVYNKVSFKPKVTEQNQIVKWQ